MRFWNTIDTALMLLAGAAAIACALHVSLDVVMKYLFAAPIPGTINVVSNYYMIVLVFAPLAMAEFRDAHIAVDILKLPRGWAGDLWMRAVRLFSAAVFAVVAYNTWVDAMKQYEVKAFALDQSGIIYTWPGYFLLPAGLALAALLCLCKCFDPRLKLAEKEDLFDIHG